VGIGVGKFPKFAKIDKNQKNKKIKLIVKTIYYRFLKRLGNSKGSSFK